MTVTSDGAFVVDVPRAVGEGLSQHAEPKLWAVLGLKRAIGTSLSLDDAPHAAGQPQNDDTCLVCLTTTADFPGAAHPAQKPGPARRGGRMQPGG